MGLIKLLLKVILIPIAAIVIISIVAAILIKVHRDRKREARQIEQQQFKPPPFQQWIPYEPVQKPAPVAYPLVSPSQMEQGVTHVSPS
ncbi:hypothetical protein N7468_003078 [Penicillium chermesinum]|uniref:Uncharacterized protein n=1 Tax=Penicillium chermesinum TaxID=63820 RepID=A0A9W9P5S2_9EURO|nr:uncharacterized protein N7468_003078 [Penicillium chermesinum]KAJ5238459.1 hypothetical protein N7468_003078 [Penicillium chermesinum]KAJ6164117.1 hypothetical protein N7470_002789 [Penicillium chermesinum]